MSLDVIANAITDNEFHVVVRNRPDLAERWSDHEVARRWLHACPGTRCELDQDPPEPTPSQIDALVADREKLAVVRIRLSDISWFMRFVDESVARWANAEEGKNIGRFWGGRFKCTRLLDFLGLVLGVLHVDLSLIRVGMSKTPSTSRHTSAFRRVVARQAQRQHNTGHQEQPVSETTAVWLSPVQLAVPPPDGLQACAGLRVSDDGFLEIILDEYLRLLDWSAGEIQNDQRCTVPADLAAILQQLQLEAEFFLEGLRSFREWFADFAGSAATLAQHAAKTGRNWIRGMRRG
jgi:hypothetical protein